MAGSLNCLIDQCAYTSENSIFKSKMTWLSNNILYIMLCFTVVFD